MTFADRHEAGILLAEQLTRFSGSSAIVLGLARGGVVVAWTVAQKLKLPLDVLIVKKIPAPGQSELAIGALAPDGVTYIDWKFVQRLGVDNEYVHTKIKELGEQIKIKTHIYRKRMRPLDVRDRTVIVVDDGIATGATLQAALKWFHKKRVRKIVAALPVAPIEIIGKIRPEVDELIVMQTPQDFTSVGQFYKNFPQIEDREVVELLKEEHR